MKRIIVTGFAILTLAACQKKDDTPANPSLVNITIANPTDGQTYHNGDTVLINAKITYTTELHGYEVKITDTAANTIVFDDPQHVHTDHFDIADKWPCVVTKPTVYKLEITTVINHDGDMATKVVYFKGMP